VVPTKLGLSAIAVACFLLVAAPVWADEAAPDSTTPSTEQPVPDGSVAEALDVTDPANVAGPAIASGLTPTRGPQVQILTPPPPEPSPFDPPIDGGDGRRVVYSKTQQTVWVYDETNTIIKMHRVSGRQDPGDPRPGTYRVWSRSSRSFSINNPTITWNYMIRFAKGDRDGNIGFHDIPYQYGQPVQTVDQLGQALSGGCVRQASEDAIWMWNWAQIGTVVVVTP
jgi:lipoprotein-anchoring transpeptidase ErfK/SrfK